MARCSPHIPCVWGSGLEKNGRREDREGQGAGRSWTRETGQGALTTAFLGTQPSQGLAPAPLAWPLGYNSTGLGGVWSLGTEHPLRPRNG